MRRTIVAIDAIHAAFLGRCDLFCIQWPRSIRVFSDIAVSILHPNPRNDLPLLIGGYERDLIREIHVPVNPCNWTTRRIAATDIYQHPGLAHGILLIVRVMIERLDLSAIKLRGPVTLFTGLIRRTHVMDWSFNGP